MYTSPLKALSNQVRLFLRVHSLLVDSLKSLLPNLDGSRFTQARKPECLHTYYLPLDFVTYQLSDVYWEKLTVSTHPLYYPL